MSSCETLIHRHGHFKAFLFSKYDWMVVILRCLWWCAFVEIYNIHSQDDFNRALVCSIIKLGGNLIFSPKQCKCHVVWHVIKCNRVGTVVHNVLRHTVRLYQKRFVYIIVPCLFRYDRNLCTSGTMLNAK